MRPLELTLSNHKPAVNRYTQMSNLNRIAVYNHDYLNDWLSYNHRIYKNQSLLVQALTALEINEDMSLEYLVEWVNLKKESVASLFNIACIFKEGDITHNTIYQPEFTELFILLPSKESYLDYLEIDETLISPIVPLCSNEILIDYVGPVFQGPITKPDPNKVALIGVDLVGLGIYYWLYIRKEGTLNKSPHGWLAQYPLINARILAQRSALLEVLYNSVFSGKLLDKVLEQNNPAPLNDITGQLNKYLKHVYTNLIELGVYDEQDLLNQFPYWGDLPVDPLMLQGGRYTRYEFTQYAWALPAVKLMALVCKVNKIAQRRSDDTKNRALKWLRQDIEGMIKRNVPKALQPYYRSCVQDLRDAVS